jgi:hypothetical protein
VSVKCLEVGGVYIAMYTFAEDRCGAVLVLVLLVLLVLRAA